MLKSDWSYRFSRKPKLCFRISSSEVPKQDDFYIDDDIPDDPQKDFTNNSIVEMLENLSTDDENELRVSLWPKSAKIRLAG